MPDRTVVIDYVALWGALNTARQAQSMSWRDVADRIGTSPSTFTRLANGKGIDASTFASLAKWLNVPAERFMRDTTGKRAPARPTSSTLAAISGHLRADRHLDPGAATQLDNIIAAAYKALVFEKKGRGREARIQGRS